MSSPTDSSLIKQLSDPDPELRLFAVKRIGMNYNPKYIPDLLKALTDSDARIREATIQSLGAIGEAEPVLAAIITALQDEQLHVKLAAIKVLGELRSIKAIKPLTKMIDHPDPNLRSAIAIALGQIEDKQVLVYLIDLLKDKDKAVILNALIALGKLGDARAVEPIIELLSFPDFQSIAAITLQKFKDPRIIPPLTQLLNSPNSKVRQCAILTLGSLKDSSVVEPLLKMLNDSDPDVRRATAAALSEIKDSTTINYFISNLKDDAVDVRETSARALGKFKDLRAIKPLIEALSDKMPSVREEAANALGDLGDNSSIKGLNKLLKDPTTSVRVAAVRSIGRIEAKVDIPQKIALSLGSIRTFQKLLNDREPTIRVTAAEALARIYITQNKFDKAESSYNTASDESFIWDFHKDFFSACAIGCKVLDDIKKEQFQKNQSRFQQIFELIRSAAKTEGKTTFISESFWIATEAFNNLFLSRDKEEFLRNAHEYSLRMMLLNKKLPESLQKIIEKPLENLNQKFQIINKRGMELSEALQEIQSLIGDLIKLGIQILILEPLDLNIEVDSNAESEKTTIVHTVLTSQLGNAASYSTQSNSLIKLATSNSGIPQTTQTPNFIVEDIEIGKEIIMGDKNQFALMQILKGSRRTSLIEENRDIFTRYIDRYYDLSLFQKQNILRLKKDAIEFAIKSKIIGFLDDAIYEGANICIFPELVMPISYIEKLQEFSNRNNIFIISGMEHVETGDQYHNRACICIPNEKIVYIQKNTPTIIPSSDKFRGEWKEKINFITPPLFPLIKSPFGKFTILIGQDINENGQYLVHIANKYNLDFIIFITFIWQTDRSLQQYQNYANEIGKPIFFVNSGQFGGTTVFKPKDKPNIEELLQESTEKIVWYIMKK